MKKSLALLSVFSGFILLPQAHAGWDFRGGDSVAIEFQESADLALREVQADPQDYPQVQSVDFDKVLSDVKVLVSDQPLYVESDGVKQESTAVNSASAHMIIINRARWTAITAQEIKNALALHEVLSLAGIEATGDYVVSTRYLNLRGMQCATDLCSGLPIDVGAFSFEKAQIAFASAKPVAHDDAIGIWSEIGVADMPNGVSKALQQYSESGFLSANGGQKVDLTFNDVESPFGDPATLTVTYTYFNDAISRTQEAGSEDAYSVLVGTTGIHFATSGSILPSVFAPNSDGYFDYECRTLAQGRMLCAGIYSRPYSGIAAGQTVRYLLLDLRSKDPLSNIP